MTPRLLPALFLAFLASCRLFAPGAEDLPKGRAPDKAARTEKAEAPAGLVRVYFSAPGADAQAAGNIADRCAQYIDNTERTLDVAAFELDNRAVVDALVRAARRGVVVRLVTESDYLDESGVRDLKAAGVPVVDDRRDGAVMHCKFMVFDDAAVWTGSMNFTENCAYKNDNHGVYIPDRRVADNFAAKFRWMFEAKKFGGAPAGEKTPYPAVTLADGTEVATYFSTVDKPAGPLRKEIDAARTSIHFLAFSFTHKDIAAGLVKAHDAGVEVAGVFETTQGKSQYSQFGPLRENGIGVAYDGNPRNMHHKAMVFDGAAVACGSFNFSASANDSNDENMVIVRNRDVAAQFEAEFRRVRGLAKNN